MILLTLVSVPLYDMFCKATGLAGTTGYKPDYSNTPNQNNNIVDKVITVQFDSNVAKNLPWKFYPLEHQIKIKPGQTAMTYFYVENQSDKDIIATSIYNVSPQKVGQYFVKIQCFCFEEQLLRAGESMKMPVLFAIDKEIATNPETKEVNLLTLSYTFFRIDVKN